MPKKYFFYLVGLLLLVVAGMYGFTKWTEAKEKVNLWTLVPEDAVFIVESADHTRLLRDLQKEDFWENLTSMQSVGALMDNIAVLDSLAGRNEGASRFLKRKTLLTSLHVVSKTDFDFVFYIPVNTVGEHRFIRTLVDNINKSKAFTQKVITYQDFQIVSIRNQRIGDTFYYFSYHNNLVISANFELVKEIIRKINREQLESPAAEYQDINYLKQEDVFAHIFVNYHHIPQFLSLFLKDNLQPDITFLASLCRSSMLGLKKQKNKFLINGFSNPELLKGSFYNQVKTQNPQPFNLRKLLPARTAFFMHVGADQISSFRHFNAQDKNITWPEPQVVTADSLVRTFRHEMGIAYLETNQNQADMEKVIFARSGNPGLSATLLQTLSAQTTQTGRANGTQYEGYILQPVPVAQFPLLLFGSVARGFEQCYFTQVEDYFLFAPDIITLRTVLTDLKAGQVWSETEAQKLFLENTQQEANFSLYLNTRQAWRLLNRQVRENHRSSLLRNESFFKKINQLALQFSQKDDQYYTTFVATHPEITPDKPEPESAFDLQNLASLPNNLQTLLLPEPVATEAGRNAGFLVQDENLALHRIGSNGQIIWTDTLPEALVSPVYQVYLGRDKAAKQLFATPHRIYCLDQNGRAVENFPFNLPDTVETRHLAVFDFKQNRNYQFLISNSAGGLLMFDPDGNIQAGWNPKVLEAPLAVAPQEVKINGRDVILIVEQNGYIYAYNPQGEIYPGFPVDLETPISSGVFIQSATSFSQSRFTVLTQDGQRVTINFAGKVVQRKLIPGRKKGSTFELLAEPGNKSYIISKQEAGKVSLFDQNLRLLLERNFITSSRRLLQYFDFGPLHRIYVLTETGPHKTYLYNYQAKLIGGQALNNRLPVTLQFNANTNIYSLFLANNKDLQRVYFRDK